MSVNIGYRCRMDEDERRQRAPRASETMDPAKRAWMGAYMEAAQKNMQGEQITADLLDAGKEIVALFLTEDIATRPPGDNVTRMTTGRHHYLENALELFLVSKEEHTTEQLDELRVATLTVLHNHTGWLHDGLPANDG
jgi:hypothetical protein